MSSDPEQERDPEQQQQWMRQLNLTYVGLIGIALIMVQPLITAQSLDQPAKISVVAFAVAIPLLAALVLLNQQETFRRRLAKSIPVELGRVIGQMSAFVGVVAGFWHIYWLAGAAILAAAFVGAGVHSAGYMRLEGDNLPPRE